ncbi:mucin-3A-like isoform X2 [Cyprinus carpio]|uniref:Mucin-3A-like isoform X2 n=1 Tax=Cyprinus carpio TaxID=7962 RepID=A0A9Q9X7G9_CYPCA|nr:mucin-3A-like isoform X2 [Cyprinus carpio]
MLISIVFILMLNPVLSLQGTLSENKNGTTKSKEHTISHNIPKLVTTTLTTKVKIQTYAASSKSTNQPLNSTPKPVVDGVQKPVPTLQDTLSEKKNSTTKSKWNAISLNVQKPVTPLSNPKTKNPSQSASSKTSSISQTLLSTTKPTVDVVQNPGPVLPGKLNEKKNSTAKTTAGTGSLNLPKLGSTALNTKPKNQTHPTSLQMSSINQTLPSTTKLVAEEIILSEKKNSTVKSTVQTINVNVKSTVNSVNVNAEKPITTLLKTKKKDQTQSTSSTTSRVNQTLPSSTKPDVETIQKPVQGEQNTVSEKKNSTAKTTANTGSLNLPKLGSTALNTKLKNQTHPTSLQMSSVNQTLPSTTKLVADEIILSEKKNSTVKSTFQTINVNVSKKVATLLNTKTENQTQYTSSKTSSVSQRQDIVPKHVPSLQDPLSEKKNSTVKSTSQTIKVATTLLKTKLKDQISSKISRVNQTLSSSTKPDVDTIQKPVQSVQNKVSEKKNSTTKSTVNSVNVNSEKPVTTLLKTKMKDQTQSTSLTTSRVNQTLSSSTKPDVETIQKPVQSEQNKVSEKKNSTTKSTVNSVNVNAEKPVTTLSKTKMKDQTQSTSLTTSRVNQTLSSSTKPDVETIQKPVQSEQNTVSEKKNSTIKSAVNSLNVDAEKPVTTLLKTKMKDQTQSTSLTTSRVNQTLSSSTKPDVETIQKPVQSEQNKVSEKKNSTTKSTVNSVNVNAEKPITTLLKTKKKDQTQSTSLTTSRVNQTLSSSTKPDVETIQKPVQSEQNKVSEKKNSTIKSAVNSLNVDAEKPVTTLLKTKMKDQTQSTSLTTSRVNQTLPSSTRPDVETIQKPVHGEQNTVSEKKNSTTKSTVNSVNVKAEKPVTTLLKTKMKDQTQSTSFTTSRMNHTLSSSTKPDVETIQKPVQSEQNKVSEKKNSTTKSTVNSVNVNAEKPITTLLKTKKKDQTQSTSSTTSRVNQTLPSSTKPDVETIQKPVQGEKNTVSEKKISITKSTVYSVNVNTEKPVTTLQKTKMKDQTQSNSSKNSTTDQTLLSSLKPAVDVVQKPVSSLPATTGAKKTTSSTESVGHIIHVNASKSVNTKMINQTYSVSSKPSNVGQTLVSTAKPVVDVQKSGPSLQGTISKKKNYTSKLTTQTISHNIPKLTTLVNTKTHPTSSETSSIDQTLPSTSKLDVDESTLSKKKNSTVKSVSKNIDVNPLKTLTTSLNIKTKTKTQSTSSEISNVNQTVASTTKPVVDRVQNPTKDKPAESSPVKVVITEGCVPQESQTDSGNVTKVQETELSLNPGSPLVMTHHINLVQGACTGSCDTEMATLRDRVEFLEKEMAAIKKMCVQCSGEQCPKNCSSQGKCEDGKCVCFQGFSGPDCSGKTCPSNCNKKGNCVKGKCVCQTGYTGLDCSKAADKKITVTVETVALKIPTAKPDTKHVKTKPDKTIFVKKTDTNDTKTNTTAKPTVKPSPTVSPGKAQSNTTKRDKFIKTIVQVLLNHEGRRRQEQAKKGKTTIINLELDKQSQTDLTDMSKKNNLKDKPVYQNVTRKPGKKVNGTSKVSENVFKGTKESSNSTVSKTKVTIRTVGDQAKESKTINVTSTGKEKKLTHSNVTTTLQAEKSSDKHINGTGFASKTHTRHFNKTISRLSVIGSVEVHNITSTGFIMSWEAHRDIFKNFTISRREIRGGNEDSEKIQDGAAAVNVTDVQRPSLNRTSTKVQSSKPEGKTVKNFYQVLAGTARSYHFKGLQPQTRYSVSLFGSGLGIRSKIHRLTLSTGPEPPTDLMFSNITETSFSVSWAKPKSIVAEFKVTYTNIVTGESGSMSVDSQLSHVLLSKLSAGSTYDITVSSVLETLESEPITASVTTVPDSPTELKVVNITDTKALLVWKPSQAKVDSYILSYGTTKSPNVTITVTLSGSTVEHQLRGLHRSSLYMVKIKSQVNRLQSSPVSTTFTTGSVKLQVLTPDEVTFHSAVISWKAPRVAFKSYRLTYQLSEEVKEVILNPSVTRYELTGLAAFSNYTVKIDGERDGQYISFVYAEFTTAQLPHPYPTDCSEVQVNGMKESGEAEIYPEGKDGEPVWVYCDMETEGGGWTVFQRRMDGSTDFFRTWRDYSKGFGSLSGEFWLGNDILHALTSRTPMSLRIDLRSGNDTAFAHYTNFNISSETNHYEIELSGYFGTAGDSMKYHNRRPFSTKDRDPSTLSIHCAKAYLGGWWYKNCYKANLNGLYASYSDNKGVVWIDWKGKDASLPFTEMKLRPSYISQTIPTTPTTQG